MMLVDDSLKTGAINERSINDKVEIKKNEIKCLIKTFAI